MAKNKTQNNGPLNSILRVTKQLIDEHKEKLQKATSKDVAAQIEPVDCKALYDVIQAAQSLYTENCPGP